MIKIEDQLPEIGKAIFIKLIDGSFPDITFQREADEDWENTWIEPYQYPDLELAYQLHQVESWIYVDDLVKLLEGK